MLAAVQKLMPELGIPPHRVVFVSGIGCAGRFAYYMDTYGMHGIHGRAPALATGLAAARDDLSIWIVTGDGDALSIGGNHLIHALRRNVPVKILMFNNQIYGLTKGQASPTSELGKVTKSTPFGAQDEPFNPLALALGAGATFAARTVDRDRHHMTDVLRAAAEHEGTAFVEIYQNCPVFNDGAFFALTEKDRAVFNRIPLVQGEPIRFGPDGEHGVARAADGRLEIVAGDRDDLVVHDAHRDDPAQAFALARLADSPNEPTPIGVFRAVERPVGLAEVSRKLAAGARVDRPGRARRAAARRRHLDRQRLSVEQRRLGRRAPTRASTVEVDVAQRVAALVVAVVEAGEDAADGDAEALERRVVGVALELAPRRCRGGGGGAAPSRSSGRRRRPRGSLSGEPTMSRFT